MQPTSNDASRLSKSLLTVVRCLLARMSGRAAPVRYDFGLCTAGHAV